MEHDGPTARHPVSDDSRPVPDDDEPLTGPSVPRMTREREALERRVDDLRAFEREYRSRLKEYLEGQIRDLDAGASDFRAYPAGFPPTAYPIEGASAERERYKAELERQLEQLDRI